MNALASTSSVVPPPAGVSGIQILKVEVVCDSGAKCRLVLLHSEEPDLAELSKLADIVFAQPRTVRRIDPVLAKHLGWSVAMAALRDIAELRTELGAEPGCHA